jgi:DNA-binding response OmpR family regulator
VNQDTSGNLLIVDDERSIRLSLRTILGNFGFGIVEAARGEEALALVRTEAFDAVLLDINMPGMGGIEVCRLMRKAAPRLPILMLTVQGGEERKVEALDAGADDYITKPFGLKELLARVHAALRRAGRGDEVRKFGQVEVDLKARKVTRAGKLLDLTAREFDLLRHFLLHPEMALSREQLMQAVWGIDYFGTARTVDNFIVRLRDKLEDDPAKPRYIETVRGVGYRFTPTG